MRVHLGNGRSATSDATTPVVVGNLPPVIDEASFQVPPGELVGPVPLQFIVSDTDDLLDVRIEVNVDELGGFPGRGLDARPAGAERERAGPRPSTTCSRARRERW